MLSRAFLIVLIGPVLAISVLTAPAQDKLIKVGQEQVRDQVTSRSSKSQGFEQRQAVRTKPADKNDVRVQNGRQQSARGMRADQTNGLFNFDMNKFIGEAVTTSVMSNLFGQKQQQQEQQQKPIGLPSLPPGNFDLMKMLDGQYGNQMTELVTLPTGEQISPMDHLLIDLIPQYWNASWSNQNGTASQFKELALSDTSNDDAVHMSGQQLILRSGYKYELYDAVADDGYITQVTRLINPLADKSRLRYPPIVMEHGGTIDPTAYLLASSIQHFPEVWPRGPNDGPIRSSNRSLAFFLANHGFDVFLCETRGANDNNNRHIKTKAVKSALQGRNDAKNRTFMETVDEISRQWDFWAFTQDDIIAHELKSHIDTVMKVTGAHKVSVFTFSLSTPTSFAFLSIRPDYAEKVHGFVSMAPIISGEGTNGFMELAMERVCPMIPDTAGTLMFTDFIFSQPMRDATLMLTRSKVMRYSFFKMVETLTMGPSEQYRTNLELNLIGHLLRRLSFKEAKQLCQQMSSNKLQKYDYGPLKNQQLYGSTEPPVYDISNLKIKDWMLITAWNDAFSTPQVVDHLLRIVNPKPSIHVVAPYNHLDLIAAFDNDKYTNFPVLHYFEKMSFDPREQEMASSTTRSMSLDLKQLLAPLQLLNSRTNLFGAENQSEYSSPLYARSLQEPSPESSERAAGGDVFQLDKLPPSVPINAMARSFQQSMRSMISGIEKAVRNPKIELPIHITEVRKGFPEEY